MKFMKRTICSVDHLEATSTFQDPLVHCFFFLTCETKCTIPNHGQSQMLSIHTGGFIWDTITPDTNLAYFDELKWATSWQKLSYAICKQQRSRSACASMQSDQHLCCSLLGQYNTYTCYIQTVKTLASLCTWAGRFESYLGANPEDRFSRDVA